MNCLLNTLPKAFFLMGIAFAGGCGVWVGNPPDKSDDKTGTPAPAGYISLQIASQANRVDGKLNLSHIDKAGASRGTVQLSKGTMVFTNLVFYSGSTAVEPLNWGFAAVVDLSEEFSFALRDIPVPAGTYDQIELKTEAPNAALSLEGTFILDTENKPLNLVVTEPFALTLPKSSEFAIESNKSTALELKLDLNSWFNFKNRAFDLTEVTSEIKFESAPGFIDIIRENVESGASSGVTESPAPEPSSIK